MEIVFNNIEGFLRFYVDLYMTFKQIPISKRLSEKELEFYLISLKCFIKGIPPGSPEVIRIAQEGNPLDKAPYQQRSRAVRKGWILDDGVIMSFPEEISALEKMFPKGAIPEKFSFGFNYKVMLLNGDYELPIV